MWSIIFTKWFKDIDRCISIQMLFLQNFFKLFTSRPSCRPLGRWNIDYCIHKINHKIDLSNEDHCGPCGQYRITKIETENIPTMENLGPVAVGKPNPTVNIPNKNI